VSKILSPALRIGWVVSPPAWTSALREPPAAAPPVLDQLAFAAFLRSGSYDRHLRAGRKRYRARRDNLVAALTASIPQATVSGAAAGLHLLLGLGAEADSEAVRSHALKLGVRVANLDRYRCSEQPWQGLVLGYGNLADHQVDEGVALLATAIHRLPRPRRVQMPPRHDDNIHLTPRPDASAPSRGAATEIGATIPGHRLVPQRRLPCRLQPTQPRGSP
jgi:GntR family transcriptional regulator / MocR family aminotransferase